MPQSTISISDVASAVTPCDRWRVLFGSELPRSAALIEQAIAWKEQVVALGDVSVAVRQALVDAAESASDAGAKVRSAEPSMISARTTASDQLSPGTRLIKLHGGQTHVVEVTAGGMLYEGQLYASLSAVAKAITGTHWNGLLFFGLRKRKTYPAKVKAHG